MTLYCLRIVFAALLCLAGAAQAGAEALKLRYGQAVSAIYSIYALPLFIAERQGFFAREGIEVESILVPGGGDNMVAALEAGSVDLTHVATAFLIRDALAGSDAVAIAAEFDNPIYSLIAKPEIASFADLKGKLLGLADEAGTITLSLRKLLALNGLGAGDFRVKTLSGTPARLNCLTRGACDAVALGQPQDLAAMSQGYRRLGLSTDAVPKLLYTVTAARRSWAAAHRDAVTRYVRALAAAFRFIRDPGQRPAVIRTSAQTTRDSEAIAAATLALYFEPERQALPLRGEIDLAGLRQVIAFMGEAGLLQPPLPPAERFVDLSYLRAAGIE